MRVTVLITIVSTQLLDREEERMELSVRGRLSYHGGTTRLLYTETDDEGTATRVTITCTPQEVTVERTSPHAHSLMRLRTGERYPCDYGTPFGVIPLVTHTHRLCNRLTPSGGTLELAYALEMGGDPIENTLHLRVQRTEEILQ
jgi:uncharacterized beta-barrel protein YwiB (DUF1934 family)